MYCGRVIVVCEYNGSVSKCVERVLKWFVSFEKVYGVLEKCGWIIVVCEC